MAARPDASGTRGQDHSLADSASAANGEASGDHGGDERSDASGRGGLTSRARIACVGLVMLLAIGFVVARAVELQSDGRIALRSGRENER